MPVRYIADTSVLLAALLDRHEFHRRAVRRLNLLIESRARGYVAAHNLFELYSNLTGLPGPSRVPPADARDAIADLRGRFTTVTLDQDEYHECINRATARNIVGGGVFDLLVVAAAEKIRADVLLTFDVADFRRIWPERADRIIEV